MKLVVLNLETARFDCTFGRGCDGVCCRNGRPPIYPDDARTIDENLDRIRPLLRSAARAVVERVGYLSRRRKAGQAVARVVSGWCVFFNKGCALHRLGAEEGEAFRYKPWMCAVFPLSKDGRGRWYVRQKGYKGEIWDLACLDPDSSPAPAATTLHQEVALVDDWESRQHDPDATDAHPRG